MAAREIKQCLVEVTSQFSPEQSDQSQHRLVFHYQVRIVDPDSKQEHVYDRELAIKQQAVEARRQKSAEPATVDPPPPTHQAITITESAARPACDEEVTLPPGEEIPPQNGAGSEAIPKFTNAELNESVPASNFAESVASDITVDEEVHADEVSADNPAPGTEATLHTGSPLDSDDNTTAGQENADRQIGIERPAAKANSLAGKLRRAAGRIQGFRVHHPGLAVQRGKQKLLEYRGKLAHFVPGRFNKQHKASASPPVRWKWLRLKNKRLVLYGGMILLFAVVLLAVKFFPAPAQDKIPQTQTANPVLKTGPVVEAAHEPPTGYHAKIEHDAKGYTITLAPPARVQADLQPVTKPATPDSNKPGKEIIHIVSAGDTLWFIAKRYVHDAMQYPELARLSNIKNPHLIYPGDQVRIVQNPATAP